MHQCLLDAAGAGAAVLLISEDLDEIFALADRIGVMYHGRLSPLRPAEAWTLAEIGLAMAGSDRAAGACGLKRGPKSRGRCRSPRRSRRSRSRSSCVRSWSRGPAFPSAARTCCCSKALPDRASRCPETLTRATPLILTGLAVAVAFRAKLYNIGAEGQLYVGALAAVAVGNASPAAAALRDVCADDGGCDGGGRVAAAGPRAAQDATSTSTRWSRRCCSISSRCCSCRCSSTGR